MRPTTASATFQPLDHLLGTPALVRVTRVLTSHGRGLAIPDLARRARLALPSTRGAVRRLVVQAAHGADSAYATWYEHMLTVTAPTGLPYAYWDSDGDWELGMTHLKTTAGGPVPTPPPGGAQYHVGRW